MGQHASMADVFLILGFPGVGKFTVAKALRTALEDGGAVVRLVDNHYVANPVFGVIPVDGETTLPTRVWDLVGQVRSAVLTAIEELSDPTWTFVFTNFVRDDEAPAVAPYFDRLQRLAELRGGRLRLVCLTCDPDEQLRRIALPDRVERMKSTSRTWLRELLDDHVPHVPGHALVLDVTSLSPPDAARAILANGGHLNGD